MTNLIKLTRSLSGVFSEDDVPDSRIKSALVVSALQVTQEAPLSRSYEFDFFEDSITPDPTDPDTFDPLAISLFTLKAACLLNQNQYASSVSSGIRVRDGSSEVDTTSAFGGYRDILRMGPCKSYNDLLTKMLRGRLIGRRVTPYCANYRGEYWFNWFFTQYMPGINIREGRCY